MVCDDDSKLLIVYIMLSLIGFYCQINIYFNLIENYIEGNFENEMVVDLYVKVWEVLLLMFVVWEEVNDEVFEGMLV